MNKEQSYNIPTIKVAQVSLYEQGADWESHSYNIPTITGGTEKFVPCQIVAKNYQLCAPSRGIITWFHEVTMVQAKHDGIEAKSLRRKGAYHDAAIWHSNRSAYCHLQTKINSHYVICLEPMIGTEFAQFS